MWPKWILITFCFHDTPNEEVYVADLEPKIAKIFSSPSKDNEFEKKLKNYINFQLSKQLRNHIYSA